MMTKRMREKMRIEMRQKKCRWFLLISFVFFAWTAIEFVMLLFKTYLQIQADFPNDPSKVKVQFCIQLIFAIILLVPGIVSELSFIRSSYKMLKHEPKGGIKVCYMISALLALFLVIFLWIILVRIVFFPKPGGENDTMNLLLVTGWPSFLLSFVLGSLPIKHRD